MQNADWLGSEAAEIRASAADAAVFGLALILTDLVHRAHPAPDGWDHDGWHYHPVAAGVAFTSYSRCGDVWYAPQYAGSSVTYVVVNPPY